MISIDVRLYNETIEILRGVRQLPAIYFELKKWLFEKYQITAYNFEFHEMTWEHPKYQYRLFIMLSSKADRDVMLDKCNYSAEKQLSISEKFYQLAQKHQMPSLNSYKNVFIAYCDFSEEIRTDVNNSVLVLLKSRLVKKYRPYAVWDIFALFSSLTVFYQKDSDIQRNLSIGISKKIKDEYYKELHRLDEFCVFTYESFNVTFDSKENLDNHYEGNLYYYFK